MPSGSLACCVERTKMESDHIMFHEPSFVQMIVRHLDEYKKV